jgi:hypothetical protein
MTTRKRSGDDEPTAEQLPADAEEPTAEQLPAEAPDESPADPEGNRGKSEEAHANAPGQQKRPQPREDPNTYPDPENPPHTP